VSPATVDDVAGDDDVDVVDELDEVDEVDVVDVDDVVVDVSGTTRGGTVDVVVVVVVVVDVVVCVSRYRIIESGVCMSRPSSVSHAATTAMVAASAKVVSRRRRMAPDRRGGCHPSVRQPRR
jgi:hypothetical protein